jgi:uncharacterized protein
MRSHVKKVTIARRKFMQNSAVVGFITAIGGASLVKNQLKTAQANPTKPVNQKMNQETVEAFFTALETGKFAILREIFAEDARQLMPYAWGSFPTSFEGKEGIYQQYSSLPKIFGKMSFPRTIYATENPDVVFVQFKGDIEIKAGGRYQNDYIGIFKFEQGLIKEYWEYFNPILVSKAFNVPIN